MEIILYPERVPPRRVHTHNIILKKKEKTICSLLIVNQHDSIIYYNINVTLLLIVNICTLSSYGGDAATHEARHEEHKLVNVEP